MRGPDLSRRDGGFALPLAIAVLVAVTLVVALVLDGAIAAFRSAGADLELARVEAAAETALASTLDARLDTAALRAPNGTTLWARSIGGRDSETTTIQVVSGQIVRVVVQVRRTSRGDRLSAGRLAFAVIVTDSTTPAEVRISLLPHAWWAPIP